MALQALTGRLRIPCKAVFCRKWPQRRLGDAPSLSGSVALFVQVRPSKGMANLRLTLDAIAFNESSELLHRRCPACALPWSAVEGVSAAYEPRAMFGPAQTTVPNSPPSPCAPSLGRVGVTTLFIEPDSPWENGYIESLTASCATNNQTETSPRSMTPGADRALAPALQCGTPAFPRSAMDRPAETILPPALELAFAPLRSAPRLDHERPSLT
jgi:hypothetical protein